MKALNIIVALEGIIFSFLKTITIFLFFFFVIHKDFQISWENFSHF